MVKMIPGRNLLLGTWLGSVILVFGGCGQPQVSPEGRHDIVTAVKDAAAKDCGCGKCAARGCEPCHGKNCYFCVAKALDVMDCGCKQCSAGGCSSCGPGCDVCKFHLAPLEKK